MALTPVAKDKHWADRDETLRWTPDQELFTPLELPASSPYSSHQVRQMVPQKLKMKR